MTNADEMRQHYRDFIEEVGEEVIIRRKTGTQRISFDVPVMARVVEYQPSELVGSIEQGDVRVIALAEGIAKTGFEEPVRPNDYLVIRGKEWTIQAVDGNTRRVQGVLLAYEFRCRG